ncbi:Nif3-like dinuclear metal center hexameric protein [Flavitalea sp.]|nr:Nif3-like dinuclear metal center hexameric protein [Flavitalea sp.]
MNTNSLNRRKFIVNGASVLGSALIMSDPLIILAAGVQTNALTVGQIMDLFIKEIPDAPFANTVDTLKSGNRDIVVTGIVTTMFATIEVIRKAVSLKANFIVAHEPTFYNHQDQTKWLEDDDVYQYKAALLKEHNIAVWRNHDYVHSLATDGVRKQVVDQLGWSDFGNANQPVFSLNPVLSLKDLIDHAKKKLGVPALRYIGNLSQPCGRVLLMPGAAGGMSQIRNIHNHKPDVLVCGEVSEWETAEYVRDARAKGDKLALVVLGHAASEEPGSLFMARWFREKVPAIKTTHLPAGNSLSFR